MPEPGGRGASPPFFPPGAEPPKRPAVDCKPGSVPATPIGVAIEDHSSRPDVTDGLERSDPDAVPPPHEEIARFGRAILYDVPI